MHSQCYKMAVLLACHIPFLLHLEYYRKIFNDLIGIKKIERLFGSIHYISHTVSKPFAHDQYSINWLISLVCQWHLRCIYTRACDTRVNASRQTHDILWYLMINLYVQSAKKCSIGFVPVTLLLQTKMIIATSTAR